MKSVIDHLNALLAEVKQQQTHAYAQVAAQVDHAQIRHVAASIMLARLHVALAATVSTCLKSEPPVPVECVGNGPEIVFRLPGRAAACRCEIQDAAVVVVYVFETIEGARIVAQQSFPAPLALDETTIIHAANLVAISVIDWVIKGIVH